MTIDHGRRGLRVFLVGFQDQDNLGLRYLSSAAQAAGHDVSIITYEADPQKLVAQALIDKPALIGLSLIFQYMTDAFASVVKALRQAGVEAHITMGGHYPSFAYGDVFAVTPGLDSIVRYEGEATLVELLRCLEAGEEWRQIRGLAYLADDGRATSNCLREPEADLDRLAWPDREDIRYESAPLPTASVLASRGCPWDCSFCSIRPFYEAQGGKLRRLRKPEAVVAEMESLHRERGVRVFLFQDDDFLATGKRARDWSEAVADEIMMRGLHRGTRFKISCRSDEVREDNMRALKAAGLTHVYMGVESGDEQSLANMNKMLVPARHIEAGQILRKVGLSFDFGFMLMEPYSDFQSIRNNIAFLEDFVGDGYTVATFCRMLPYAGTPIRTRLEQEGRLKGTATQPDYDFLDPRLDLFYSWAIETFHERNFTSEGLSQILRVLGFEARLDMEGRVAASKDDRAILAYLTEQANRVAFLVLRRALDHLESFSADNLAGSSDYLRILTGISRNEESRLTRQAMELFGRIRGLNSSVDGGFARSWTFNSGDWEARGVGAA